MTSENGNTAKQEMTQVTARVPVSVKKEVEERAKEARMATGEDVTPHGLLVEAICERFKPRADFLTE